MIHLYTILRSLNLDSNYKVAQLKKAKRELEQKLEEYEEDLEESAAQIASLQSAKTKVLIEFCDQVPQCIFLFAARLYKDVRYSVL